MVDAASINAVKAAARWGGSVTSPRFHLQKSLNKQKLKQRHPSGDTLTKTPPRGDTQRYPNLGNCLKDIPIWEIDSTLGCIQVGLPFVGVSPVPLSF